jgi:hypothetical protein
MWWDIIYIKIMLKKIDKIFIILMTIFLVVNILAIGFIFVDSVSAQNYTCPFKKASGDIVVDSVDFNEAGAYQCPPPGRTRVQVAIPGLTETCTYKTWELDDKGEPQDVSAPCYSAASLPDFVRRIYTFSIGLIAVIAVFMIMLAGLTLIFAAGNASAISRAKSRITVSILGVVLALLSYVILDTLNPRLTNLSLPGITPIDTKQQSSIWCSNFMKADGTLKDDIKSIENNGQKIKDNGKCDQQYDIKFKDKNTSTTADKDTCWGSGCNGELTCLKLTARPMCFNLEELCKREDNNCDLLNRPPEDGIENSCRKKLDKFLKFDGGCYWGKKWPTISDGPTFISSDSVTGSDEYARIPCKVNTKCSENNLCTDSDLANMRADNICVRYVNETFIQCINKTEDCSSHKDGKGYPRISVSCDGYSRCDTSNEKCCASVNLLKRE